MKTFEILYCPNLEQNILHSYYNDDYSKSLLVIKELLPESAFQNLLIKKVKTNVTPIESITYIERLRLYYHALYDLENTFYTQLGFCEIIADHYENCIIQQFPELLINRPLESSYLSYWYNSNQTRIDIVNKIIPIMEKYKNHE